MRLLAAELRKLRRPLLLGTFVAVAAVGLLVTRSGALLGELHGGSKLGLASTSPHDQVFTSATGIGRVAAGLMSSLPGVAALLFLAGGHVAGEWSGRTLKSVLVQDGRRWRWVGGKVASLWVAGVAMELALWAVLAAWTFGLRHWWPPSPGMAISHGLRLALPDVARSLLALGMFAALATLAAIVTRSMLGTLLGGMLVLGGSMGLSNIAFTRELPSYWVTGWMRFHTPSVGAPYQLWNDKVPPGIPYPGFLIGLVGVAGLLVICAAVAGALFARTDVAV